MTEASEVEAQMLVEARAEVSIADQKAGVVLAAAGIGFGAVLGGLLAGDWRPSKYGTTGEFFWWLAAMFAFGVVVSAALAIWPRFTTRNEQGLLTYWGHIAEFDTLPAFEAALDANPAQPARTRHQLWRLAKIARTKYLCIRCALASGGIAAPLFLIAGMVG